MNFFSLNYLYNAAIIIAAFFLGIPVYASFNASIVQGKIESIRDAKDQSPIVKEIKNDDLIQFHDLICSAKGSRAEFRLDSTVLRIGSLSVLSVVDENSFFLHSGSMLISFLEKTEIHISTTDSKATFTGSGTILVESTKNGGFKFIPFEGRGILKTDNNDIHEVKGGRLVLVLGDPSQLGDAYDVDLMLLIKTCRLLNSYPDPLETFGRISLAVYSQELKLKGKYNALIGDAPTDKNLQIWAFGEE